MLSRCGTSAADERARAVHRRLSRDDACKISADFDKSEGRMGGPGSSRWRGHTIRETVERSIPLDTSILLDADLRSGAEVTLTWGVPFLAWQPQAVAWMADGILHLRLVRAPTWEQAVEISEAPRGFGRTLYYRCRGQSRSCGRRVSTLYWPIFRAPGFLCRSCHQLAYESQRMGHKKRGADAELQRTRAARGWT
jgi:hypothetical protein